jgi:AcrR family transcriptional regulator
MARKKTQSLRDCILDAAVKILSESGIKRLAQPQVAKEAKVRQSHLTYYFPKRSDLILAVTEKAISSINKMIEKQLPNGLNEGTLKTMHTFAVSLLSDRNRSRMLLGLLVESDENSELRTRLQRIAEGQAKLIALLSQRPEDDPKVALASSALYGMGIKALLYPNFTTIEMVEQVDALTNWLKSDEAPKKRSTRK